MEKVEWLKKCIRKIHSAAVNWIFPKKGGVDFSQLEPEELFTRLPKCADMRGAAALSGKRVSAALSYKNRTTRAMIWNIKFKKDPRALRCGAYILHRALFPPLPSRMPVIVIPMPIFPARRRERGYNQCELLAQAMLEQAAHKPDGNPCGKIFFELRTDILVRIKNIEKQTFKNRRERMESMKGAFALLPAASGGKEILSRTVIILDDVITTGSTMREAIDCLERAGFKNVVGFGLAH